MSHKYFKNSLELLLVDSVLLFALLLSYWKKRMSTTLQVYTAKFILEASHQCQRETPKEDKILWIVLCSKHTMFEQRSKSVYVVPFLQYFLIIIKSSSSVLLLVLFWT